MKRKHVIPALGVAMKLQQLGMTFQVTVTMARPTMPEHVLLTIIFGAVVQALMIW